MCPEERTGNAGFWTESDAPYAYAKRSEAWGDESKMAETDPAAPPAAPCWAGRFLRGSSPPWPARGNERGVVADAKPGERL